MSATEPNVMRNMSAAGLASERVPQRANNPSLGKVATRLGADFKSLTQAVMRKVSAAIQLPTFRREVPIVLTIMGQKLQFPSSAEFEFAIASRAEPPTERVTELEKLTLFELRTMATDIRKLEKRLSDVLAASLEGRTSLCDLLGQLEIKLFSADHNWRAIFKALGTMEGRKYDGYRRVALAKYMQYLGERQSVIQRIYASRGSELQAVDLDEPAPAPEKNHSLHETSIFDLTQVEMDGVAADDLFVLPRGESIAVTLSGTQEVDLMLARFPFKLVPGDQMYLVDSKGADYVVRPGRNTVGRSQGCHIMVDADHREISRKHLVIDRIDAQTVVMTDLSSHGTRVPASRVVGVWPAATESNDKNMVSAS